LPGLHDRLPDGGGVGPLHASWLAADPAAQLEDDREIFLIRSTPRRASSSMTAGITTGNAMPSDADIGRAAEERDAHLREVVRWHFAPETGSPFWLDWAKRAGWNPAEEIRSCADLV